MFFRHVPVALSQNHRAKRPRIHARLHNAEPLETRVLLNGFVAGHRDTSFAGDALRTDFGGAVETAYAVAVQPDGKVLIAGTSDGPGVTGFSSSEVPDYRRITLARYFPDGSLDPGFGAGGKVVTRLADFPAEASVAVHGDFLSGKTLALAPDGSILVGGAAGTPGMRDSVLVRYTPQGAIDRSFGRGGIAVHDLAGPEEHNDDTLSRLALDAEGRVVATFTTWGVRGYSVARFAPDGALDPTFGGDGTVITTIGSGGSEATDLLPREGGGLVVVGNYFTDRHYVESGLMGFAEDGSLDPSFGTDGVFRDVFAGQPRILSNAIGVGEGSVRLTALGGGAFAAGAVASGPQAIGPLALTAARFSPAGRRDVGWGSGGLGRVPLSQDEFYFGFVGLAALPDGRLLAAALGPQNSFNATLIVGRLTPQGHPDTEFGSGGKITTDIALGSRAGDVAIDQGGGLLVSGGAGDEWLVRHLNAPSDPSPPVADVGGPYIVREGEPLPFSKGHSFDPDGLATFEWDYNYDGTQFVPNRGGADSAHGPSSRVLALRLTDADGNTDIDTTTVTVQNVAPTLIIGGGLTATEGQPYTLALSSSDPSSADSIQYWTIDWGDGSPPQRVEGNPPSVTHLFRDGPARDTITATATDNDGTWPASVGRADPTFGEAGVTGPVFADYARGGAFDAHGSIFVAGSVNGDFAIYRFTPQGRLDTSFGTAGYARVPGVRTFHRFDDHGAAIAVQPDGKIVAAVPVRGGPGFDYGWAIVRMDSGGTMDGTFGDGGVVRFAHSDLPEPPQDLDAPNDLLIQPDGKIVVVGKADGRFTVLRLNPDGTFDTSFGPGRDGRAAEAFSNAGENFVRNGIGAMAVRLMPDGRIVAVGSAVPSVATEYAVARYMPDGTLDPSFAGDGTLGGVIPGFSSSKPTAMALADDGSVVFAVESANIYYWVTPLRVHLVRLRPDGSFDPSFGDGGLANVTRFFGQHAGGVALLPGGKVLVAGGVERAGWLLLERLLPDGSPDPSFGSGGLVRRALQNGVSDPQVHEMLMDADGNAVLVTSPYSPGGVRNTSMLLARFNTHTTVDVANAQPAVSVSGSSARPGVEYSLSLNYADPGDDAPVVWIIDWGDGSDAESVSGRNTATHTYVAAGAYTVTARAVDEDGSWLAARLPVRVIPPATLAPDGTLTVVGSDLADSISLSVADGVLSVDVAGLVQSFAAAEVNRIDVSALGGADAVTVGAGVSPAAGVFVLGGAGDDTVTAAVNAGNVVFDGGANADTLIVAGTEGADVIRLTPSGVITANAARTYAALETLRVRALGGSDTLEVDLGDLPADSAFPATQLDGGAGDDVVNVITLAAARTINVFAGLGRDAVNILPGCLGTVALDSNPLFGTDAVTFAGTEGDDTFEISSRQVRHGDRLVTFPETFFVNPPWTPFTLTGGGGNDRFVATARPPSGMVLDGGEGDDRFEFLPPGWPVDSFGGPNQESLTIRGGAGLDTIVADARSTQTQATYSIGEAGITAGQGNIRRGDAEAILVLGGSGAETFRVTPGATVDITVHGNDPAAGAERGDRLMLFTEGAQGRQFEPAGDGAGRFTFTNRGDVEFSGIEHQPEFVAPEVSAIRFLDTAVPFLVFTFSEPVTGLNASLLTLENLDTGAKRPASNLNAAPSSATFGFVNLPDGRYRATLARGNVIDASGNRLAADVVTTFVNVNAAHVAGRHVFDNNSAYDGNNAAQNAADDDGALAADKRALLPGQAASFANVTSSAAGINGVMLDLARTASSYTPRASDFSFAVADPASPGGWRTLTTPPSAMTFRRGAGVDGTDRITFTWPNGTIRNTWLRVRVNRGAGGLPSEDVFYFGSLVGKTGDATRPLRVTALDLLAVRRAMSTAAGAGNVAFDVNRDGRVNALDLTAVRLNLGRGLASLPSAAGLSGAGAADPVWDEQGGQLLA